MKLVRDLIPQIIEESGKSCEYHVANYDEYKARLYKKMREELDEFIDMPCYEEAADMYEVLRAICEFHDLDIEGVERHATVKRLLRGGFNDRIILEKVNQWKNLTRRWSFFYLMWRWLLLWYWYIACVIRMKGNQQIYSKYKDERIKGYKKLIDAQEKYYTPPKQIAKNIIEAMKAQDHKVSLEQALAYMKASYAVFDRDFYERNR